MKLNTLLILSMIFAITSCKTEMTKEEQNTYFETIRAKREREAIADKKEKIASAKVKRAAMINEAREFALENTKDLNEEKRNYIRYTAPHISKTRITKGKLTLADIPTGEEDREDNEKRVKSWDIMQTLATWYPPNEESPVTVAGTSKKDLTWWQPTKIVRERKSISQGNKEKAVDNARMFAINKLLYLQDKPEEQNIIRFNEPVLAETKYDIDVKNTSQYKAFGRKAKSEFDKQEQRQASFLWRSMDNEYVFVVTGSWSSEDLPEKVDEHAHYFLRNWIPVSAQAILKSDVKQHLVK